MKYLTPLLLSLFVGCMPSYDDLELSHMRKSRAIMAIMHELDVLEYDESQTELDRDRLKLNYLDDFIQEVSGLLAGLNVHQDMLPNKKPLVARDRDKYQAIIALLEENIKYLKMVQKEQAASKVLTAMANTRKSCKLCHSYFRKEP